QEPDVRIDALDDFAVELEHQPQYPVRGWMLRPEIDVELADLGLSHAVLNLSHSPPQRASLGRAPARAVPPTPKPRRPWRRARPHAPARSCLPRRGFCRLLVPGEDVIRPLPGRFEVEGAPFLREPYGLVDDALLVVVVAHLDIAGEGKVLAQGKSLKAVI